MARLIDADKLIEEFKGRCVGECDCCSHKKGFYCGLIDDAPTVNGDIDAIERMNSYQRGYTNGYHQGLSIGKGLKEE